MFNKTLFNKTLFNRLTALFPQKSDILLYGQERSFDDLEGLFRIYLDRSGLNDVSIDKFGRLLYSIDVNGEYSIFFDLGGTQVLELIKGVEAEKIIKLIGKVIRNGKN